jgi:hypothetical protein
MPEMSSLTRRDSPSRLHQKGGVRGQISSNALLTILEDYLQVAIDVSGNGQLPWPPVNGSNIPTQFYNVTLFLTSYDLGHNFTISNATASNGSLPFLNILQQEPGSTVKHVNWVYPLVSPTPRIKRI